MPVMKLEVPNQFDFTETNKAWNLEKLDPERLLYVEATGIGAGMKTGDIIIYRFNDRLVKYIINFIEYPEKDKFRLSMIFIEFIN